MKPIFKALLLAGAAASAVAGPAIAGARQYEYDTLGRVTKYTDSQGRIVTYNYDKAGNRTAMNASAPVPPVAVADSLSTSPGVAKTIDPRANDSDANGDALTITSVTNATHGAVAFTATTVTYTPAAGYVGDDSFTYTISDGHGGAATAAVSASVINRNPTAVGDAGFTVQNTAISLDPRVNDSDADGDALTVAAVGAPANGTAAYTQASVTYTPTAGYVGGDNFTYTISDGHGGTAVSTVSMTIDDRAPVAVADSISTSLNTAVTFNPRTNDNDPDGDVLTISGVGAASHGGVVNNSGASITYTPAPGYVGADSFTYTISDGKGKSATATVSILVNNRWPTPLDDTATTVQNTAVTLNPRANDSDPDGDALTITAVGGAGHGSVVNNSGASLTYTPSTGYVGTDGFTYTVSDGRGGTATANVSVTVNNRTPTASADTVATNQNTAVTFNPRANDSDPDGDTLTISAVGGAGHGSVVNNGGASLTYTPTAGYVGVDSFTYTISDGKGGTATATVSVTVNNRTPTATADAVATNQNTALTFDPRGNDSDPDGDALTISAVGAAGHGSVVNNGTSIIYAPAAGYVGADSFTYTISDGKGGTATATVSVNVNNRTPTASADAVATNQNIALTFDPRANDSDPDGDALTISAVGGAGHGSVVNNGTSITYTPAAGYVGADSFTYTISDGKGGTATAPVSVSVNNRMPTATADAVATNQNTALTFDPRGNDGDPDGDVLTVSTVGAASHGTVVNNGTSITYTPAAGYVGADAFTYTISDGKGGTATAAVVVTVVNRPPTAGADAVSTPAATAVTFDPRGNDGDADGDALTVSAVGAAAHGSVVNNGTSITYTPAAGYVGADAFTYTISDGKGGTATATVSVTVVNRSPIARPDTGTAHQSAGVTISPLINDSDPDGDPITIISFSGTNIASEDASIVNNGTQIFFVAPFATATKHKIVVITYTISDGRGGTATSTYTIDVGA